MPGGRPLVRYESAPVVGDRCDRASFLWGHDYLDTAGTRVLDGIGDGFLGDPIDRCARSLGKLTNLEIEVSLDVMAGGIFQDGL